jgi:hypothetical protein
MYKKVLLEIKVPEGDYCWDSNGIMDCAICEHLAVEGRQPQCNLGFYDLEYDEKGFVPKPKKCRELPQKVDEAKNAEEIHAQLQAMKII